jgi:predicted Ser/Thr protein kinase
MHEDDPMIGSQLGAYRVESLLGIGGMGRVYKGVHPKIGSRVAIKVLSRECSDRRDLVERFFAEAKAVNVVAHESIVNVLDLSMLPDGRPYIVMEYLDGAPLAALIEQARTRGPLPIGAVARLVAEILDALGAAHAKGIIHRDLKPDNVYVSPAGRAKVLDFGIAKLQPELGGSSTHTGSLLGTPHYMSPEQASGRPVDARADLYSIGVILFECLTLQKPFVADSLFELLRKHIETPPPPPRALRPDLPPELEHVILTALAKAPEQRYQSAQAMSVALQQATASLAPEQWAPLQPAAPSSHGWDPTPPASWARNANRVTTTPPRQRQLGPWIALAAIILVGGGITAVALATGGSNDPIAAPAVAAPAPVTPPAPAPTPPQAPAGAPTKSDDAEDDDDLDASAAAIIDEALGETKLPPAARAAVAKYGSWAKVPAKLRKQLATALTVLDDDGPPDLGTPPNWKPAHAEPDTIYDWAIANAKKYRSDAKLFRIDIDNVFPDGHADLTLASFASSTGDIDLRFTSAAPHCQFRVDLDPSDVAIRELKNSKCGETPISRPRCTLAKVWQKAIAKRSSLGATPASIMYYVNPVTHRVIWNFTTYDGTMSLFSEQFADDC